MKLLAKILLIVLAVAPLGAALHAAGGLSGDALPKELGRVAWGKDLDKTLAEAKKTRKPALLLFQEIPG